MENEIELRKRVCEVTKTYIQTFLGTLKNSDEEIIVTINAMNHALVYLTSLAFRGLIVTGGNRNQLVEKFCQEIQITLGIMERNNFLSNLETCCRPDQESQKESIPTSKEDIHKAKE